MRNYLGILEVFSKELVLILASESYLGLAISITHYALRIRTPFSLNFRRSL